MGREPLNDSMKRIAGLNSLFQEIEEKAGKLEEEKRRLSHIEKIFQGSGAAIIVIDRKGRIKFFSRGAESLTGYKLDEIKNKDASLLFPDLLQNSEEFVKENGNWSLIRLSGKYDLRTVRAFPSKIDDNMFLLLMPVDGGIEGKEIGELIENAPFGIYIIRNKLIKYANTKMLEILGCDKEEVIGKPFTSFVHPEDARSLERLKGENLTYHREIRFISKKGIRHAEITVTPIKYMGESAMLGSFIDTTERKLAEEALYLNEKKYRQVVENAVEGIYRITLDGEFLEVNDSFLNMFGYESFEELVEETEDAWQLYIQQKAVKKFIQSIKKRKKVRNYEMEGMRKDGRVIVTTQSAVLTNENGNGVIEGIIQDITARKKAEEEAEFYNSLLRHDLGNKNQIIMGYLELLSNNDLSEKQRTFLEKALQAVRTGNELIEKIRYLHQASEETGIRTISLEKVAKKVVEGYVMEAEKKGIEIKYENSKKLKVRAGMLVEEVIANLLENSIKHSNATKIKIYPVEEDGFAGICIEDNGVGVPEDMKEEIFKKKVKGKRSSGSGLGLYLVKKIVEKYGGKVEVADSEGGGAKFIVYFEKR